MKKNALLLFLFYICFAIYNANSQNNILDELEFYSAKKHELKEKNKSNLKKNLNISQERIDDLIDNREKLSSDKNDLKILDQNIKINYFDDGNDINFIQDKKNTEAKIHDENDKTYDDIRAIQVESVSSPILSFITKTVRPFLEARIDNMLIRMGIQNKLRETVDISSKLKIHVITDGAQDSRKITCGSNVEISLKVDDEYGNSIRTDYDNQKFWLTVGRNNFTRGLELGLIGAKIGEEREIIAPFDLNIGNSSFAEKLSKLTKKATFKIRVHDITEDEELNNIQNNLRYYDSMSSLSRQLSCGDFVKTDLKLLNASGEILYEKPKNQILYLMLGSNTSKYLEQILLGVHSGGNRITLAQTNNLETLKGIPALKGIEKILNEYRGVVIELSPTLVLQ